MSTSLGKRTRSSGAEPQPGLPQKRTRRSYRKELLTSRDEAPTPASAIATLAFQDQENKPPVLTADASVEATPSRRRSRQVSVSGENSKHDTALAPITPSTPRHYDVFAKPSTPRHRVMSVGRFARRLTPQTPVTPSSCQTIYQKARQLFSSSADAGKLTGREEERARVRAFVQRCTSRHPGGCLYVSGPPGTGKSAMVTEVTHDFLVEAPAVRMAYINCMTIKSSKDLYTTLLWQLASDRPELSEQDTLSALHRLLLPRRKSDDVFMVVLDEVDHILTLDLESLYRLFDWSLQKTSRLALVGIANALDLTDRFLPRLKSRNLKPELLAFMPYTAPQVQTILETRLMSLVPRDPAKEDFTPFFHPGAIELCSRKICSQGGDLRRAFEICRKAIDLVESESRMAHENELKEQLLQMSPSKKALGENMNLASGPMTPGAGKISAAVAKRLGSLTVENAPRVSIGHLNKVTSAAFSHGASQRLKALNLQQKAALCTLMALEKRNRAAQTTATPTTPSKSRVSAPTVKRLFDAYRLLCTHDAVLHPLSSSEFREVVGSLETLSLLTPVDGKTGSFAVLQTPGRSRRKDFPGGCSALGDDKRVASCVGEKEIEQAVEGLGVDILRSILSGDALDR